VLLVGHAVDFALVNKCFDRNFMHENRETSETPAAKPGGRTAGEGLGRTARMHIPEESDGGVVPMNHSNKDGKPSAESAEGRPPIKENARQPNTYPTQSEKRVSQGLAGVRKAARENKEMKFTALLHHLTIELLRESFYSLKRKAAPGVDGVTWQEYEPELEDRLVDLHSPQPGISLWANILSEFQNVPTKSFLHVAEMGPLGGPPRKGQKYHGQTQPQCQLAPNDATLLNSERNPKKKHNLRPSEQMEVGFDADWGFMLVEIDQ
jgi:hypothetical protein